MTERKESALLELSVSVSAPGIPSKVTLTVDMTNYVKFGKGLHGAISRVAWEAALGLCDTRQVQAALQYVTNGECKADP